MSAYIDDWMVVLLLIFTPSIAMLAWPNCFKIETGISHRIYSMLHPVLLASRKVVEATSAGAISFPGDCSQVMGLAQLGQW